MRLPIIEGLVTTVSPDGTPHLAPMGPWVDLPTRLVLRPFGSSQTYRHLCERRTGVFHVTDDVEWLAQSAIGAVAELPPLRQLESLGEYVLQDCCRWYAFRVTRIGGSGPRFEMDCEVEQWGRVRDFAGLNRAKHAVVEAAILTTRLHLIPADSVARSITELAVLVEKTGGEQEHRAMQLLRDYVQSKLSALSEAGERIVADSS